MSDNDPKRLAIDSPAAFQTGVDSIPPGGRAYLTFDDLTRLTGQTCDEFMGNHDQQNCKTKPTGKAQQFQCNETGAPERIRTSDPQIRSLVLYPAELRARRPPKRKAAGGTAA